MSVTKQVSVPSSPVIEWWGEIQPAVTAFSGILQCAPMLQFEDAEAIARQLKRMYKVIEQSNYPFEAQEIYTHVTRAVLNLFMCYEALANFQWDQGDIFYGRAASEWTHTKNALHQESMGQAAS